MFRATELAQTLISKHLKPGDWAVDATLGNGNDALFLKRCVGKEGRIFGFDPQIAALEATRLLFCQSNESVDAVELFTAGHESMQTCLPPNSVEKFAAMMFNLGYLPKGDHSFTTKTSTTKLALEAAETLLSPGGIISVIAYPGHPGGTAEGEAVRDLFLSWKPRWKLFEYRCLSAEAPAPYVLFAQKASKSGAQNKHGSP